MIRSGVLTSGRVVPVTPAPPAPSYVVTRLDIESVAEDYAWSYTLSRMVGDAGSGDGVSADRGFVGTGTAWARFRFPTPAGNLDGTQTFRVRAKASSTSGTPKLRVKLFENGTQKADLGTVNLTTSWATYTWTWSASLLSQISGADVELRLEFEGGTSGAGYTSIDAIDWEARHVDPTAQPSSPATSSGIDEFTTDKIAPTAGFVWYPYWYRWGVRHRAGNEDEAIKCSAAETSQRGDRTYGDAFVAGGGTLPLNHQYTGGTLRLLCHPVPSSVRDSDFWGFPYTAGMIAEDGPGRATGYWECKFRIERITKGQHFAIWLLPADGSWPPEVDIVEVVNTPTVFYNNAHIPNVKAEQQSRSNMSSGDHIVGFETDGKIARWWLDGAIWREQAAFTQNKPLYFLASWEIGGKWSGDPDATTVWPGVVVLDYVRYYPKRPGTEGPDWVPGWGPRPALGSHQGVGQAFNVGYNSQGQLVWQPLRDYNEWLGRPADVVKVWPNMARTAVGDWDGIAGGAGDGDTTWGGQLNELNPTRAFDPNYWPISKPIVFALTAVPLSHANAQNSNGTWQRPGIWQEIARGDFDVYYQRLFRRLATRCGQTGRDPRPVVIRWCWEANGNWYQHSIGTDKTNFINAWRRCMDIMRSSVAAVLGAGKSFMIEFGPSGHLRFGSGASERLWNVYPGDDWVDICGLGIHDQVGISTQAHWDQYLTYPATIAGTPFEGIHDWFDFAVSRNKWLGTSEIECNYNARTYFPKTQNMDVFWRTGFERVRQRYAGRFVYFIYLWNGDSALKRPDGWGEPYRLLYRP